MDTVNDESSYYNLTDEEVDNIIFTKDVLNNILCYEKTVSIVGVVDSTEIRSNLVKFTLVNRNNETIQCIAWDLEKLGNDIKKIVPGNVLHLDGAFARPKHPNWSKSVCPYDLTVMSNTIIRILNTPKRMDQNDSKESPLLSIANANTHDGIVQIDGFIKNEIKEVSLPSTKICQGCMSDCENYKLEIRMPGLYDMSEFKVGFHVKVTGTIKYTPYPHIWVLRKEDVTIASTSVRKITELLKGNKFPLKRSNASNTTTPTKIIKKE